MSRYVLEICSNSTQSALNAQIAGAKRVELCSSLWESGTTPSYASIKKARELLQIELFVLIRPRGGDFIYSDLEFEIMKENILMCKELGVDGIVSGVLNEDNTIDIKRTKELIELSKPLPFTFHRAFDITPSLPKSLKTLIELKADRVLTSGGKASAANASNTLAELQNLAKENILLLPGGGINKNNISKLLSVGCTEFHLTGNSLHESKAQKNKLKLNGINTIPENEYLESSIEKIQKIIAKLNQYFDN